MGIDGVRVLVPIRIHTDVMAAGLAYVQYGGHRSIGSCCETYARRGRCVGVAHVVGNDASAVGGR